MNIDYDTEFIEDGRTIDLISIGMMSDDGREYYAVNSEMPVERIQQHEWLMANVVPSLPLIEQPAVIGFGHPHAPYGYIHLDMSSTLLRPRRVIANEVRDFILAAAAPELWAWYGDYDHVALCQLWGAMIDLPKGVPMWTHDLKQECERLGNPELPSLPGAREHNALDDAREVQFRHRWLMEHAASR